MESKRPTAVFFGGTFDPPHKGHRLMMERCLEAFPEATVIVVPSAAPAGAFGQHKEPVAEFSDRVSMAYLAFEAGVDAGRVELTSVEDELPKPNYTWATLDALVEDAPDDRWALLLGYDQLASFAGWQKAAELVKRYDLIAVEREGSGSLNEILVKLGELGSLEKLDESTYQWKEGGRLYILSGAVSAAASREYRSSQAEHGDWLDAPVAEYINAHKLYE